MVSVPHSSNVTIVPGQSYNETDHDKEDSNLIVVFHIFSFFLLGLFFWQCGEKLYLKYPPLLLYFAGMLMGGYYHIYPPKKIPVLDYLGSFTIRLAYCPIYIFLGVFNIESEYIQMTTIRHVSITCVIMWAVTTAIVPITSIKLFNHLYHFQLMDWVVLTVLVLMSDLCTTKHFMVSAHSFASQELFVLLELESLTGSCIASVVHDMFIVGDYSTQDDFLLFALKNFLSCVLSFMIGKFAIASMIRMHYDQVNQITTIVSAIYFTYAMATGIGASGVLSVLTFSLVFMASKPALNPETVNDINRFLNTLRYGLVSSVLIVAGITLIILVVDHLTLGDLFLWIIIFMLIFICRFIVVSSFWMFYRKLHMETPIAILTISACNIRSVYNLVLAMTLLPSEYKLRMENKELFLLANVQVFLSTILSTPMASIMFEIQGAHTLDKAKYTMVKNAMERINESKELMTKVMRSIQFTVDADWDRVVSITSIEAEFYKRFTVKTTACKKESSNVESLRVNTINDVLRLQRRFFEEQLRRGEIATKSAKQCAYFLRKSMHGSTLMSFQRIIHSMGPYRCMQIILRDLIQSVREKSKKPSWMSNFFTILFVFDMYMNVYTTLSKLFLYSDHNEYVPFINLFICACFALVGVTVVLYTGKYYCHTVNDTFWNWIAWTFFLCSTLAFIVDFHTIKQENEFLKWYFHLKEPPFLKIVYYVATIITSMLITVRSMILACMLWWVQCILIRVVYCIMYRYTFNQCDACQGFLQVMIDTHQRLESRGLNLNFEAATSDILHQESLAMRQFLGVMEILTPDIMTAVRSRIACRLVLLSQEDTINELDKGGLLDAKDVSLLTNILRDKLRKVFFFKTTLAEPYITHVIDSVPWVAMSGLTHRDILKHAEFVSFKPGDVIAMQGCLSHGLFIILKGLIRVEMKVKENIAGNHGTRNTYRKSRYLINIPVTSPVDKSFLELSDFYTRGNVIGEYIYLTGRPGHKTYRCATKVLMLMIPSERFQRLIDVTPRWCGHINRLEHAMWRAVAIRQAARLIQWRATYQLLTRRKTYTMMEDSYVIGGEGGNMDTHLESSKNVMAVLVHGEIHSPSTGISYHGPVILPSSLIHFYDPLQFTKSRNTIVLIIRSLKALGLTQTNTALLNEEDVDSTASQSDMTVSSGTSDGIPYSRQK